MSENFLAERTLLLLPVSTKRWQPHHGGGGCALQGHTRVLRHERGDRSVAEMWRARCVATAVLLLLEVIVRHVAAQNTNFSFSRFPTDDGRMLKLGDVSFTGWTDAYDMNHRASVYGLDPRQPCARLLYKDSVWMRTRDAGLIASFNTSFTFAFRTSRNDCRGGMAFTFAADQLNISATETNRSGSGMCAFDYADMTATNRVFAVKFDSSRDDRDPSDSSVGVVVSSRGSTRVATHNFCPGNATACGFFCRGDLTAWIDYDGEARSVEVRLRNDSLAKPIDPLFRVSNVSLDESVLENEHMYAGFSSSAVGRSGERSDVHRILAWNFTSSRMRTPRTSLPVARVVGSVFGAALGAFFILALLCVVLRRRKQRLGEKLQQEELGLADGTPRAFTYKELSRITKRFSDSELLSAGAYGDVYRGTLRSGALVAVKLIKHDEELGEESFHAEATSLRQIRHRNLLQLRGWCHSREGLLLVYDYMCNGSLDKWLYGAEGLSWERRRVVLTGVASGLQYLHEEWVQCVLHRDIKPSNVLLDVDFSPYLGDFGLARMIEHRKAEKTTLLAGTLGYMAPEMQYTGRASKETDVYAFGILVLEVVCGRRPLEVQGVEQEDYVLLDVVWRAHESSNLLKVAEKLESRAALDAKMMIARLLHIGLLCCLPNPSERPSMRLVNQWFQSRAVGAAGLPPLPATRPRHTRFPALLSSEVTASSASSAFTQDSSQTTTTTTSSHHS